MTKEWRMPGGMLSRCPENMYPLPRVGPMTRDREERTDVSLARQGTGP